MTIVQFDPLTGNYKFNERNLVTDYHSHPALEIIVAKQGVFTLETPEETLVDIHFACIRPNQLHAFKGENSNCDFLFVEPGIALFAELSKHISGSKGAFSVSDNSIRLTILDQLDRCIEFPDRFDNRISESISYINSHVEEELNLTTLAQLVHLSPSRFSHLFKEHVGITLQKYVLWTRLKHATNAFIQTEANLTHAALIAGFHDSSHFTKQFKHFFGVKPSSPYNNSSIVQV
jgi:AraC-like DNA-binding protein